MAPNNPVTNLSISVWPVNKFGQVSVMRQNSSRHHSATPASHLRAARAMRHLLREMDPLMGLAPYSYGGPRNTPAPAVTVVPESNAELGQLITNEFEAVERWTAADILEREG